MIFRRFFLILCTVTFLNEKSYAAISLDDDSVLTFLVSCSGRKDRSFYLILFFPLRNMFHIHRLDSKIQRRKHQKKSLPLELLSDSQAKEFVEDMFAIPIQNVINARIDDIFGILRDIGGIATFNLESVAYPKGRIVIDENNFIHFMDGFVNKDTQKDVAFSLVVSILQKSLQLDKILSQKKTVAFFQKCNKTKFFDKKYQKTCLDLIKNIDDIALDYSRMNVVITPSKDFPKKMVVPLVISGEIYDRRKIYSVVERLSEKSSDDLEFSATVQVRNTTNISRLAARLSGFLQRRKFAVSEFLNSSILVQNSLIICRSLSPKKLQEIQKHTKIYESYYITDYRESSDFAVFLAKDFFMAKDHKGN